MATSYSWVRRNWVVSEFSKDEFGINTISKLAEIPIGVAKDWCRRSYSDLNPNMKKAREYERAIGILLIENFSNQKEDIASLLKVSPSILYRWKNEDRNFNQKNDLYQVTHLLIEILKVSINEFFQVNDQGHLILSKNRWPSDEELIKNFEKMMIYKKDLLLWANYRYRLLKLSPDMLNFTSKNFLIEKTKMNGPHPNRYRSSPYFQQAPKYLNKPTSRKDKLININRGLSYSKYPTEALEFYNKLKTSNYKLDYLEFEFFNFANKLIYKKP